MISLRGVSKSYGALRVLNQIDLHVAAMDTVAVLGPNGSGKTTLLKLMAGILRPDSGTISVDETTPREARARIGFAGHDSYLYPHLTVLENLTFFARMYGVGASRAREVISASALEHRSDALVGTLSRGETQRASLARATVHDPQLLIVDEPLTALDETTVERLEGILGVGRRTVVIATHDLTRGPWESARQISVTGGRLQEAGR